MILFRYFSLADESPSTDYFFISTKNFLYNWHIVGIYEFFLTFSIRGVVKPIFGLVVIFSTNALFRKTGFFRKH